MKLTKSQQGQFWRVFAAACSNLGISNSQKADEYRHQVLMEVAGDEHIGNLDRTAGFDSVMGRLAEDAGDYELAAKYVGGGVERYRKLIVDRAGEIVSAGGGTATPERYVAGIIWQGRLVYRPFDTVETFARKLADGGAWMDIPQQTLRLVLQIVTSEWRKVCAGKGVGNV